MKWLIGLLLAPLSPLAASQSNDECLASAIYYEANTEAARGRRAVYDVIQHRMTSANKTACQIVKEKGQFSWWPKKPIKKMTPHMRNLLTSVKKTPKMLVSNEKYFFQKHLKPKWARKMECTTIGQHKFCRK